MKQDPILSQINKIHIPPLYVCDIQFNITLSSLPRSSKWFRGPGSVVGTATAYGLDGLGIESRWGRGLPHFSRPALRSNQPPVQWVPDLSRG
jgi:hypothetical protein